MRLERMINQSRINKNDLQHRIDVAKEGLACCRSKRRLSQSPQQLEQKTSKPYPPGIARLNRVHAPHAFVATRQCYVRGGRWMR